MLNVVILHNILVFIPNQALNICFALQQRFNLTSD